MVINQDMVKILVVDDDRELRELLAEYLENNGFQVTVVADGQGLWQCIGRQAVDLVILDLMLPGEDGLSLCRRLCAQSNLPVLMLTALSETTDRIVGLEMGADDYLTKPFEPRELLARIRSILRRSQPMDSEEIGGHCLSFAGWTMDSQEHRLTAPDGEVVELSHGEFRLLQVFLENTRQVLSRDRLLDLTRGLEAGPYDRSIDIQVSRLRRRLREDPRHPELIKTIRSEGYLFAAAVVRLPG